MNLSNLELLELKLSDTSKETVGSRSKVLWLSLVGQVTGFILQNLSHSIQLTKPLKEVGSTQFVQIQQKNTDCCLAQSPLASSLASTNLTIVQLSSIRLDSWFFKVGSGFPYVIRLIVSWAQTWLVDTSKLYFIDFWGQN